MKQVKIVDLKPGLVKGVEVQMPNTAPVYKETYFEWTASGLTADFKSNKVSGGVLNAWHHAPVFDMVETHVDAEMFYFISGTAIMLFADIVGGAPDMNSAQIVRIKAGTQIIISAGKAHFVAVAEGDEPLNVIVVSPKMDAPRVNLPTAVEGI